MVSVGGVAAAVTGIDLFLGIQEKNHHRQVIVEVKQIEIQLIDPSQPHANELFRNVFQTLETDNLPVKLTAIRSRLAPKYNHERFAGPPRFRLAFLQAGKPAVAGRRLPSALSRLSECARGRPEDESKGKK